MLSVRLVIAALLAVVGLVWIGQGIGLIGGSFMTGSSVWAVVGVVLVVAAAGIAWFGRRPAPGETEAPDEGDGEGGGAGPE